MKNKTAREYKKAIKELTTFIISFENAIEKEMLKSSTTERGKRIAKILNELTMANQIVLHFILDYSFKKIDKLYSK